MITVSITIQRGDGGSEDRIEVERFEEADAVRDAVRLLKATADGPLSGMHAPDRPRPTGHPTPRGEQR